jgi:hypothetical protein
MVTTRKRKVTVEVLGKSMEESGVLSSIDELEEISEEGMTTTNTVVRNTYACGHKHSGKDSGTAVVCSACGGLWCPQCGEKTGFLCQGCGVWICEHCVRITLIGGYALCKKCRIADAVKRKVKEEGGILEWLLRW